MRSGSSYFPVDMQQIPSTFDTACLLGSHGRYVKYVEDGTPVIGGVGNCTRRWTSLIHCVSFSLVFVGRDYLIPADDLPSCIARTLVDFRVARSQATPRLKQVPGRQILKRKVIRVFSQIKTYVGKTAEK